MENNISQEIKPVKVIFGDEEQVFEFKHAIIHGVESGEEGRLMSLIYGYKDISDFSTVYTNNLIECYQFLQENYEGDDDVNVLKTLKEFTLNVFNGIENGDFDESLEDTVRKSF